MATELEELLSFLSSPSPPVKKAAVDIVRDYTGSEDGLQSLGKYATVVFPSLSRLLAEKKEVSEPAAEALVNLSQNLDLAKKMVDIGMVKTAMDILYKQGCDITQLLVMLLVNLTQLDAGIDALLQSGAEKIQGLYVMKLVRSFCMSSTEKKGDPFEHVASVLVNISKKEAGRKLLLDSKRGLFKQIIRQFDATSPLRRKGVSGTIRNCCFEAENQLQNFLLISEFLWPALLLPVAGNKELCGLYLSHKPIVSHRFIASKTLLKCRSSLQVLFQLNVSQLLILKSVSKHSRLFTCLYYSTDCLSSVFFQEGGRRAFWSVNGPRILQVGYEDEKHLKVMEAYEQVGALLIQEGGFEESSAQSS